MYLQIVTIIIIDVDVMVVLTLAKILDKSAWSHYDVKGCDTLWLCFFNHGINPNPTTHTKDTGRRVP